MIHWLHLARTTCQKHLHNRLRCFSIFFFYWYGHHRDLHSFPTRRSSDLNVRRSGVQRWSGGGLVLRPGPHGRRRSEEHTSELQSPMYLVCRLLLEKKKLYSTAAAHLRPRVSCNTQETMKITKSTTPILPL